MTADAVGDVLGRVIEQSGSTPDLAFVTLNGAHEPFLREIQGTISRVLEPAVLVGAASSRVIGEDREVEESPALALWAAWDLPSTPFRVPPEPSAPGDLSWLPDDVPDSAALVLLADDGSFPVSAALARLHDRRPDIRVVGGVPASIGNSSPGPVVGGHRLLLDGAVHGDGVVGVVVGAETVADVIVGQGCRPIGTPMVVTEADGAHVLELAGQPALTRLLEVVEGVPASDRALLAAGIHVGVLDEARDDERDGGGAPGDVAVRVVLGGDRARGVLALTEPIDVGTTVRFQIRDAAAAHADLLRRLAGVAGTGALLFADQVRDEDFFGLADHDPSLLARHLPRPSVAGLSCSSELGPFGPRSAVHHLASSALIVAER